MLSSIRKFSTSIYAKVLLALVIIPFVFWGMGSSFTGGNKNVVVVINEEKYSIEEFVKYIQRYATNVKEITDQQIEESLSIFIGEKLIQKEVDFFKINLSDKSLSNLLKQQKQFKKENKFSRTEYEKFLLLNNISAVNFEYSLAQQEKRKQFIDFIRGGIVPPDFLIETTHNEINQKRNIQLININNYFENHVSFSEDEIKLHYETNKDKYKEIFKSIKILELKPETLTDDKEYSDMFFKEIDEIDNILLEGKNLNFIEDKYKLNQTKTFTINRLGKDESSKNINDFSEKTFKNIFSSSTKEQALLLETENKYFIIELVEILNIDKGLDNENIKNKILLNLKQESKNNFIYDVFKKISKNDYTKLDFDNLIADKNLAVERIKFENKNDNKILKGDFLNKVYSAPLKKVTLLHDVNNINSYLVYVDKIVNVNIGKQAEDYKNYFDFAEKSIASSLLNTYDVHIKNKYKVDINYKALDIAKNYFK
jgi:peptidyl-prolyl cis-trans isomerase D